jgi:NaMN:DMB phosphoribosyltransferase
MAIGANSYASVAEVEALAPHYATSSGSFDATTRPTLTEVERFIDRVSGTLNVLLAEAGFAVPVAQADAKLALDGFVAMEAAYLVMAANGAGPWAPGSEAMRYSTPARSLMQDAAAWVEAHADGIEALGATRARSVTYGLQCRDEDDGGNEIEPMWQREMMGNEIVDWDSDE